MTDLSKLSDDQLRALYQQPATPLAGISDDELRAAYEGTPQRGMVDKLTGATGPRYQTWPEKVVRGLASSAKDAFMLPGQVMQEATTPQTTVSDSDASVLSVPRAMEFSTFATPVNPAVRAGDRAVPGVKRALQPNKPQVPTTRELKEAGAADITAARQSGLEVRSAAVGDYSRKLQQDLYDGGINPIDAPATFAKLKELEKAPADSFFTPNGLQSLRESLGATAQNFNPNAAKDQLAASRVIKGFDEFIPSLNPKDVLAGTPATTQQLFERGRGNYAAAMRSNSITGNLDRAKTGILERAEGRAHVANSGRNIDNTIRSKVEAVLEKPKEISGLTDAEIAVMEAVVQGSRTRNIARDVGNRLAGGGGAGNSVLSVVGAAGGAAAGGVPGAFVGAAVPAVVGTGARSVANALAKRSLRTVDETLRKRSPLFMEREANPGMSVINPDKRAALVRILLDLGINPQAQQ